MKDNFELSEEELGIVKGVVKARYENSPNYPIKEKEIIELVKKELPTKFSDKNPKDIVPVDLLKGVRDILEQYKEFIGDQLESAEEALPSVMVVDEPKSKGVGLSKVGDYGRPEGKQDSSEITPPCIFGDKKESDYINMDNIGGFLEQTLNQCVQDPKERDEIREYFDKIKISEDISNSPKYIDHKDQKNKFFDPKKVTVFIRNFIQTYKACKEENAKVEKSKLEGIIKLPGSTKDIVELLDQARVRDIILNRYIKLGVKEPDINTIDFLEKEIEEVATVMKLETVSPAIIERIVNRHILTYLEERVKKDDEKKEEPKEETSIPEKKEELLVPVTDFEVDINAETQRLEPEEISTGKSKKTSLFSYLLGLATLALGATVIYNSQVTKKAVEETKRISNDSIAAMQRIDENISKLYVPKDIQQKINDSQNTTIGKIDSKVNTFQKDINDSMNSLRGEVTTTEQNINDRNKKLEDRVVNYENSINAKILEINTILTELKDVNSSNNDIIKENRIEYNKLLLSFEALTKSIATNNADYNVQKEELEWVKATLEDLSDQLKKQQPKVVQKEVKEEPKKEKRKPVSEPEISEESRKRFDEWQRSKYEK